MNRALLHFSPIRCGSSARLLARPLLPTTGVRGFKNNVTFAQSKSHGVWPVSGHRVYERSTLHGFSAKVAIGVGSIGVYTTGSLLAKPSVRCLGPKTTTNRPVPASPPPDIPDLDSPIKRGKPLFDKGELSFGTLMGFCSGYFIKKVGRMAVIAVGMMFALLQFLSYKKFITINWSRAERKFTTRLDADGDGKVTAKDIQSNIQWLLSILTTDVQFKASFIAAFYVGIRYG